MSLEELRERAKKVSELAYSPYSKIKIGAALEDEKGNIFTGCNVENSSYSLTICAERSALFNAISSGSRKFRRIYIYSNDVVPIPCGACRQVLSEFATDLEVIVENKGNVKKFKLQEILPFAFSLDSEDKND